VGIRLRPPFDGCVAEVDPRIGRRRSRLWEWLALSCLRGEIGTDRSQSEATLHSLHPGDAATARRECRPLLAAARPQLRDCHCRRRARSDAREAAGNRCEI